MQPIAVGDSRRRAHRRPTDDVRRWNLREQFAVADRDRCVHSAPNLLEVADSRPKRATRTIRHDVLPVICLSEGDVQAQGCVLVIDERDVRRQTLRYSS